ncbi:MAG: 3-deoxy-7-phosphoheptulonate synthase [Candidatus Methylacidiphilales bacterium]
MLPSIQNVHVREVVRLIPPTALKRSLPAPESAKCLVLESRETIKAVLQKRDPRLLVVVGPCSIHDPEGALDYARRLASVRQELADRLLILMRVYFEKPRTTIGWKGLINDPDLDGSTRIEEGLPLARKLLLEIAQLGLPAATEFLDPILPQYTSDLISWAAIGARTTESQTHREMASGLSMPIGFKNGTDGSLQVAIDAMSAAMHPHSFLGIDPDGFTSIIRTTGNPWGHAVLRGGHVRTNYDPESIQEALTRLEKSGLSPVIMVDCSHANSGKQPLKQEIVWRSVLEQRIAGNTGIVGMMVESYLEAGSQPISSGRSGLRYGVSVTDPCLDWPSTEKLLRFAHQALG